MATPIEIVQSFPCSADTLYALVIDPDFDAAMLGAMRMAFSLLEQVHHDTGFDVRLSMRPQRDLPGFVRKVIGDRMEWLEERRWVHAQRGHDWEIRPQAARGRVSAQGIYRITAEGEGRCIRRLSGDFEVRLPVVGPRLEAFLVRQTEESFEASATFIRARLDD